MRLGEAYVEITADQTKLTAGLNKAKTNVAASMKAIGRNMAIAGAAIVAGFGMAIKTAAKFEQSMALTASVAGATAEELKRLSDYAREMGEQSVFSASQAADAMYFLASAGMNVNEVMEALEGTLALAAATQSDLAFTSEAVAATLSQFGLDAGEAERVANVFAATISASQATMDKLATSMSYVGPIAKSMGLSLEDTVGILGKLYDAGIDGSTAGTSLRMAFVKLLEPTTKGTAALEDLKVSIKDSSGEMRPFVDIMGDLEEAGMSTTEAINIFGQRAGPAMLALVSQGIGSLEELTESITGTNKASEMAAMQIDTFQGAMKLLRSAFEELQITLVNDLMPALKGMIEKVTEGIKKVSDWMKENPKLTETIVKWGLAIGVLMLVLGPLLMILPGLIAGVGLLAAAITPLTATIGLAIANFVIWFNVIKEIDKILRSHHTTIQDVEAAEKTLSEAQIKLAEKLGITVEELKEFQKVGASVSEMLGIELIPAMEGATKATYDFASILEEVERMAKKTEKAIKPLTDATKRLIDRIFELTHTALEIAIKKLDEERQAYIDLGVSIEEINEWYDLEMTKLEGVIDKTKELAIETREITNVNKDLADSYNDVGKELDKLTEKTFTYAGIFMTLDEVIEQSTKKWGELSAAMKAGVTVFGFGAGAGLQYAFGGYQQGTPYVPQTGLAMLHKGEAVIPASQNTYNQQKSFTSSINIQPGAIVINTPRFSGRDAKEMIAKIKREAAMQGLKFATA